MNQRRKPFAIETRQHLYTWSVLALLVTVAAAVFLELAGDVWLKEGFAWDAPLMLAIHRLQTPWLDELMKAITQIGNLGVALVTVLATLWFWRHRRWGELVALLTSVLGAVSLNAVLKIVFARPRPSVFPPLVTEHTYSFPSGHTITAMALYGFLAIILWREHRRIWALLAGALIPLVGFSRIYLGVHYPSDVLGALMLGGLWLLIVVLGLAWHRHNQVK